MGDKTIVNHNNNTIHNDNDRDRHVVPWYGQVVVGPPGSGKTTYCDGMQQYLKLLGRETYVINLDPANEATSKQKLSDEKDNKNTNSDSNDNNNTKERDTLLPYETVYDVCTEVVNLTSVMEKTGLGPNGGLVYCMEYMEAHVETIITTIRQRISDKQQQQIQQQDAKNQDQQKQQQSRRPYLLFDLPGQVELYTHSTCVQNLIHLLERQLDVRLTAVQLIDAHYCTDATKFISAALLGTTTMIRLELPMVCVLSKIDLLTTYGEVLPFQFDFFTNCHDLDRLLPFLLSDPTERRRSRQQQQQQDGDENNNLYNDDVDDEQYEYADDPEYQQIRRKRNESSFNKKHMKLHKAMGTIIISCCCCDVVWLYQAYDDS
jgi:GPN-loop GTPase